MIYRELHGYKYEVMMSEVVDSGIVGCRIETPYIVLKEKGKLVVRGNYAWDGASGPGIDTKNFMRGSLFHDALYQLMREGHLPRNFRKQADELMRKICLEDGMSKFRAWYAYRFVRMFGDRNSKPFKKPRGKEIEI